MDSARSSTIQRALIRSLAVLLFHFAHCLFSAAQSSTPPGAADLHKLFEAQRWQEIIRQAEGLPSRDADIEYYYGSALAQLGRWNEARNAFLRGRKLRPGDKRFSIELGGVAFKQQDYREAASWLNRGRRIDPADSYVNDFLASIYFLQGNLEASLKYWNLLGKPFVDEIQTDRDLKIDPALLDRSFAFAPASVLRLSDFLTSERRLNGLGIFARYRLSLVAKENEKFDLSFQGQEQNGVGTGKWQALLSIFRGLPYETIYPEYFNIGGKARNFSSLVRWDPQKRRLAANFSSPFEQNPKYRYQFNLDVRNENWQIRPSFTGIAPLLGALNLRREAAAGSISSFNSGKWGWSTGAELSHRDYRSVFAGSAFNPNLLLAGYQLKHVADLNYELLRAPEHRLAIESQLGSQIGAIRSSARHSFEKLQGRVSGEWFPQMRGDDYAVIETIRAGATFGKPPFDELFALGLERDNDLWMRAHIGTRDGRKGSAPLGTKYFLANSEMDKRIYDNGLFAIKLSPFLDIGRINGPTSGLGSKKWLWDTGLQIKGSVLGVGITFTYGKDLRSGNNAFYVTTSR